MHPKHLGVQKSTSGARAKTLDSILADYGDPTIHLVKMDVDGFECDVLSGATRMMSSYKPVFIMEPARYLLMEHGQSVEQVMSFFIPLGYRFFHEKTEKVLPSDALPISRIICDGENINVIVRCPK